MVSALRERQREEQLTGDAQYFCEKCAGVRVRVSLQSARLRDVRLHAWALTLTLALTLALTPPRCDCKRDAVRGVRLSHVPPILSFHLARFRYRRLETPPRHLGCIRLCGERDGEHRPVKLT